jgi:GNAT superfamily N-acetyltransferase
VVRAPQEARVVLQSYVSAPDSKAQVLFQDLGFTQIRTYWRMVREINGMPEIPTWPEGIIVRSVRRNEEHKAISAAYESFQDHWGFIPEPFENYLERWLYFISHNDEYDPDLWFLAEENGEIVGESLCYAKTNDDPLMGWVGNLAVRRPWRKRGVGLALLSHSFNELYWRGSRRVGLGVDSQNLTGATRLYEKAGMHPDPVWTNHAYEKELRPGVELSRRSVQW